MTETLKLALLVCDTPILPVREKYGTYTEIFHQWLSNSLQAIPSHHDFTLDPFDVVQGQYPSDDNIHSYDGFIITGSAANAFETFPWIEALVTFVANLLSNAPSIRLIGICFGHQIISRAAGEQVVRNDLGWEAGTTEIRLTDEGKRVFGLDTGVMDIIEMHRDHVPAVPANFTLLGSTDVSLNQGMVKRYTTSSEKWSNGAIHVLTVQGHPEFNPEIVNLVVDAREKSGAMDPQTVRRARERANKRDDGVGPIGKAVLAALGISN
ncbi:hypothetical protein M407DRAFT_241604 [Tulasnella calospora MUT 4182]|uniref:Glutamine amidotransferase domain-containing protein n=1 Tax=Tulasnella calospora MUT 4182 TaxID=1051891 RepID=A0A0C3LD54_9AGAM|nr:hypothetical protein M407DRAFT_241604 [Tulasnella calospora MUT 4182]